MEALHSYPPVHATARWAGTAIAVVVLGIVALAFLYSPGPPSYTLTSDFLAIHDRFYPVTVPAADVDVPQIRVVEITRDSEWRPTLRVNGFANTRYHSGWFKAANGQRVRMYWATGSRLVLIPAKSGPTVLLQVADPDQFAATLHRKWTATPLPPG